MENGLSIKIVGFACISLSPSPALICDEKRFFHAVVSSALIRRQRSWAFVTEHDIALSFFLQDSGRIWYLLTNERDGECLPWPKRRKMKLTGI